MRMSMGTIDGKKLRDALTKAKNIGLVEDTFTIGDCEVTLRSLRPDEYAAVLQESQGLNDVEYLHTYQRGHLARSIVAINGLDLHDVQFVDDEEPDPKRPDKTRTVKLELPAYLIKHVLSTWGKESVYTAYRKFGDVVELAERKAKEGITFLLPEETDEERYRRLLLEAKEAEESVPSTLVDRILDELGLMRKSTADEIKTAMEKTDQLAREQTAVSPEPAPPEPPPVIAVPVLDTTAPVPATAAPVPTPRQARPVDPHQTLQQAIAARQAASPDAVGQAVVQASQIDPAAVKRSAAIAALEANGTAPEPIVAPRRELPTTLPGSQGPIEVLQQVQEPVEITKQERFDPAAATAILDKPAAGGINPRFHPPTRIL
jgi:hypothetical protein